MKLFYIQLLRLYYRVLSASSASFSESFPDSFSDSSSGTKCSTSSPTSAATPRPVLRISLSSIRTPWSSALIPWISTKILSQTSIDADSDPLVAFDPLAASSTASFSFPFPAGRPRLLLRGPTSAISDHP